MAMTRLTRLYVSLIMAMLVAGCHDPGHDHPVYWHENDSRDRNTHQHWSRGPHTDH
ncbi:hypothetical protein SXCC_03976 [Gluconacetobacter sp. SXCC-1]|nr:hypothetical protein SXCC_03976 [Gluconacetobacter sp. SXCC-1]